MFTCASGYRLDQNDCIPGTNLVVKDLVDGGMIFHYIDGRYTTLLWNFSKDRIVALRDCAKSLIPNIDISKCFFSFDSWLNKSLSIYDIGVEFESIFAHSLCIKYYLRNLVKPSEGMPFTDVYDLDKRSKSFAAASTWNINLQGGYVETKENCYGHFGELYLPQ